MRLRFSIRDLFWLTILSVVLVAWWFDHRQLAEVNQQLTWATQQIVNEYHINSANRPEILKTLQETYSDNPNVRLVDDPKNGGIMVGATMGEHTAIRIAIMALEKQAAPPVTH